MMAKRNALTIDRVMGCVLAGGQSRRMGGGDKSLLDIGGKSMLDVILARLSGQVPEIVLNANGNPERFAQFGLPVVPDPVGEFAGPLAGVLAGLTYANEHFPAVSHVISVAGDTPFFPTNLVERLCASVPVDTPVIALASSSSKLHPVFGLWPVSLKDDLHQWLDTGQSGKVLAFVDRHDSVEVSFELDQATGLDPFFNANKPDDLATVRNTLSARIT